MEIFYEWLKSVDSTNNELKRRSRQMPLPEGLVLSADRQTQGRGRSGRNWSSPPGSSISTSILLRPDRLPPEAIPRLTLLAALATARAIEEETGLGVGIKWPNDIVIMGKKAVGILTEMLMRDHQPDCVIVGIGVNVHQRSYDPEIAEMAISLDEAMDLQDRKSGRGSDRKSGRGSDREADREPVHRPDRGLDQRQASGHGIRRRQLICSIWEHFADCYQDFCRFKELDFLLADYNARLVNRGKVVRVMDPRGAYEGTCRGINARGELLVDRGGKTLSINAGEVHVRGLYGYV